MLTLSIMTSSTAKCFASLQSFVILGAAMLSYSMLIVTMMIVMILGVKALHRYLSMYLVGVE